MTNKNPTAKECLMEAASLNPAECLAVTIVNGEVRVSFKFDGAPNATLMLWALTDAIHENLKSSQGHKPEENK